MLRRVVPCDFVENLGRRLQGAITMRKADWHQKLAPVRSGQFYRHMPPEGRRRTAQIHGNIEDATAHHSNELALGEGCQLKVQAANGAPLHGKGMIVLHEVEVETHLREP